MHDFQEIYEGRLYRPPSEAHSFILQATVGCSWNKCTYCDMYRDKEFRVRPVLEILAHIDQVAARYGSMIEKVFVADGDALVMDEAVWLSVLEHLQKRMPKLRQVSCYAMARNVVAKSAGELARLRDAGLSLLYIGPESGDDATLKSIAKGSSAAEHVEAAAMARAAGMKLSVIFLLGAGGVSRTEEHAVGSAALATAMDPEYLAALTLTVVPGTPIARAEEKGLFELPSVQAMLGELRTFIAETRPTNALFRTNHASNYLALGGNLPSDQAAMVATLDAALSGHVELRPEQFRGL